MWNVIGTKKITLKEKAIILRDIAVFTPDLRKALQTAQQSLQIAIEIEDVILQAEALEEISFLERELGNNVESLRASLKALTIYESLQLTSRLAASFDQVGVNYAYDKDYKSAIVYFKKGIAIQETDLLSQIVAINNLGEAYRKSNYLDSAKTCFKESLRKNSLEDGDYLHLKGYSLGNLGMVHAAENNMEVAALELKEALAILYEFEDTYSIATYKGALGEVYFKQGKSVLAEGELTKAFAIAQQAGLKEQIRDISKILVNFYEAQKKYAKALAYQKDFQTYQDSLVNKDNVKKLEQVKSKSEIDKREHEINFLNEVNANQKKWMLSLALGFSVLTLLIYLLFKSRKKVKKANTQLSIQKEVISQREQEKALLLRELNHRVKNNLQMIASLLNLQSNKLTGHPAQEAIITGRQRVEALSLVHRKLYQEGIDTRIYIKEYIRELVLGLFHSYNAGFEPDFEISEVSVNVDVAIPLALIINEIIINALKYAYKDIADPSLKIKISDKREESLHISISDNGIGFTEDHNSKSSSLGLKIINSLVLQLKGNIQKIDAEGTTWEMKIQTN